MSEVDDLSFVVDDGVLSESYIIERSTGAFKLGGWVTVSTTIPGWGVVSVAETEDLEMLPEGDMVTGAMVFHSKERMYLTEMDTDEGYGEGGYGQGGYGGTGTQRVSDILHWNNQSWRILHVGPYPNRTFWKAIAVRLAGH